MLIVLLALFALSVLVGLAVLIHEYRIAPEYPESYDPERNQKHVSRSDALEPAAEAIAVPGDDESPEAIRQAS